MPHCLHFTFARHPRQTLPPFSASRYAARYIPQFVQNPENIQNDKIEVIYRLNNDKLIYLIAEITASLLQIDILKHSVDDALVLKFIDMKMAPT